MPLSTAFTLLFDTSAFAALNVLRLTPLMGSEIDALELPTSITSKHPKVNNIVRCSISATVKKKKKKKNASISEGKKGLDKSPRREKVIVLWHW
jgi:hypothetical protein